MNMMNSGVDIHGLAHISGDGLLNLLRLDAEVTYRIYNMITIPPIFNAIQEIGKISNEEMFRVFNMGVGFCFVVPFDSAKNTLDHCSNNGFESWIIGQVQDCSVSGEQGLLGLPV